MKKCSVCGSSDLLPTKYPSGKSNTNPLSFKNILNCPKCHIGYASPSITQDELYQFYQDGKYWKKGVINTDLMNHQKIQSEMRIKKNINFLKNRNNIKILDVGAANGYTLYWLEKYLGKGHGVEYHFIEPDEVVSKNIISQSKRIKVIKQSYQTLKDSSYDFIFLNHVLEHVTDPIVFLTNIKNQLTDKGVTYVETPHRDDSFKDEVFPHTLFFKEDTVNYIGKKLNIDIMHLSTFGSLRNIVHSSQGQLLNRISNRLYHYTTKFKCYPLAKYFDHRIYQYGKKSDEIWLAWNFQKPETKNVY